MSRIIDQRRRGFLKTLAGAAGAAVPGAFVSRAALGATARTEAERTESHNRAFRALVDTLIPGKESDPTGAPGALEAGTVGFVDEMDKTHLLPVPLGVVQWVVCQALTTMALATHLKPFYRLALEERERIVGRLTRIKGMPLFLTLLRAPFYAGAGSRVGFDYVGYPGPNDGYEDFSFGDVQWLPDPAAVEGNLP